jgi:saccharopine dehydrogenase-like NADP-dependent oxidoreductase
MLVKKIMVFGAGLVAKPLVDYLAGHGYQLTVADVVFEKAQALAAPHANVTPIEFSSDNDALMDSLVASHDLSVSLLPAVLHPVVAKKCVAHGKPMVTASYISPAMRELDAEAKAKGIMLLNEVGVDPGIDHMSAMRVFHRVQAEGGKIVSFMSYCGGLPAPEANTNPMGYKFSWAPKGVLKAAGNNARYLRNGNVVEVEGKDLFSHYWFVDVPGAATYEAYPNRDSLSYMDIYDLKDVHTMYRGTLRSISHCDTWLAFSKLGFYDDTVVCDPMPATVREFILTRILHTDKNADLPALLAEKLSIPQNGVIMKKFDWLGFFDDTRIKLTKGTACDVLTEVMLDHMPFAENERDLLVMYHEFGAEFPDGTTRTYTSTLVDYGIPGGDSSMSRTVSLPVAIGARMILEGKLTLTGVHMPKLPEIYNPILDELETLNIRMVEAEK